jgi:hypothetical protein
MPNSTQHMGMSYKFPYKESPYIVVPAVTTAGSSAPWQRFCQYACCPEEGS